MKLHSTYYSTKKIVSTLGLSLLIGMSTGHAMTYVAQKQADQKEKPVWLVVTKTTDTNDGICDSDCSLREAIEVAGQNSGNTVISFDSVAFAGTATISLTEGELSIKTKAALTIQGRGADRLVISGNNRSRVFYVAQESNLTITNLSIVNGKVYDDYFGLGGGGIYNKGTLTLTNCTIAENSTSIANNFGGGIYNDGGTLAINRCLITGNSATGEHGKCGGGGVYNERGKVVIRESTLSKNKVIGTSMNYGAGIYSRIGSLELIKTTLSDNAVSGGNECNYGGGIFIEKSWAVLTRCTLRGNSARGGNENFGGGIYNQGTMELFGTVFTENNVVGRQRNRGGGIYHSTGSLTLIKCTLTGNRASGGRFENFGGGIYSFADKVNMGSTTMYGNTASSENSDMEGKMDSLGNNQISSLSGIILIRKYADNQSDRTQ